MVGGTGYIGSRLIPELLARGHSVRAAARNPGRLAGVPWLDRVELVTADVGDPAQVAAALAGQDVLYYLVHSLHQKDFVARDRAAARTVALAARQAGVRRIVYLGGISPADQQLSPHLASREEVGQTLLESGVPTVVLRAAVVIGSGSASFEMLRYLTERLPAMVTPRWVRSHVQPIAVRDVLYYLTRTAELVPADVNRGFDIGGPDVLTYWEMMRRYAEVAGLRRRVVVPVPLLTPWLSAQWVNLVTPVPRSIAVPLISSLIHEVVCHEHDLAAHVPDPIGGLTGYDQAVTLALARTRELDAPSSATTPRGRSRQPSDPLPTDPDWSGGTVYQDVREVVTAADPARLWHVIEAVGGEQGRFDPTGSSPAWLGRAAGTADALRRRLVQPGARADDAPAGWEVEDEDPPHRLRLRARLRLPGQAWLELSAVPAVRGSVYRQRATFEPHGLLGQLCWTSIAPVRGLVLRRMAHTVVTAAERPAPVGQPW